MEKTARVIRFTQSFLTLLFFITSTLFPQSAGAANLTNPKDVLSDNHVKATNVTHTLSFTTDTPSAIQHIDIRFSNDENGNTRPLNLNLVSASLQSITGLGGGWTLDASSAFSGLIELSRSDPTPIGDGTNVSIAIGGITNSDLGDCQTTFTLEDTCYITITTFSDQAGTNAVDSAKTTYTVTEDPSLTLEISGVEAGETANGITTTIGSNATTLPFGRLQPNQVKYIAHKITVKTNAPRGYTVYAYLAEPIKGQISQKMISPFGGTNATWLTPQAWETPTGETAGSNTGWLGANTTDSRITGWTGANQKFGPISTDPHPVVYSGSSDRNGTEVTVTYALGVNNAQPADFYTGNILYDIQPSY